MNILPAFLATSGALSFLFVGLIRRYFSSHLLDIPNHRSSHTQPTPRGGGLGFVTAFALTSVLMLFLGSNAVEPIYLFQLWTVLVPLVIIGIFDDRGNVPARVRYFVQLTTAGIAVYWFGAFPQPWFASLGMWGAIVAILLTVIGMTALINFYNFMDGLDGLVASVSAIQLAFLAIALNQPLFMILVVALLGFLWWNWSPAKIFMGDVGSTVLGATVSVALLSGGNALLAHSGNAGQAWSLLAITLPLVMDAIYTLARRLVQKENIFKPHRSHIYQRLQQTGWSHGQVATSYSLSAGAIAASLYWWGTSGAWVSLVSISVVLVLAERYLTRRQGTRMRTALYSFVRNSFAGTRAS
ncbi:MraY family glycosyltransferase [Myxacorys almedinensis]|uniref:Glycosyl transferase family 4 n=1 Tax=Myxacorys almedinensis A TaxID=2690445 RepID=A0A8J7Z956_9CYAN|nr:glycosyltransferase family 4 protein [Myxacorys almedinensis]NDJ18718.1 glycosyl transferase family 4 [Myxacorys almedinensis A]